MNDFVQLNYDELKILVKNFNGEGEDIIRLHSKTAQMVHDLKTEWIGEAAEKFTEEMECILLPALERSSQALFFAQEILTKIIKIINEADLETEKYFKRDLIDPGRFGAGLFGAGLGAVSEREGIAGGLGGQTLPNQEGTTSSSEGTEPGQTASENQLQGQEQNGEGVTSSGSGGAGGVGGGGSGSSGSSQGGSGDLSSMGSGVGAQTSSGSSGSAGVGSSPASRGLQDHIYQGGSGNESEGGETSNAGGAAGEGDQSSAGEGGTAAAAAAAAGSAVIGVGAKAVRDRKRQ